MRLKIGTVPNKLLTFSGAVILASGWLVRGSITHVKWRKAAHYMGLCSPRHRKISRDLNVKDTGFVPGTWNHSLEVDGDCLIVAGFEQCRKLYPGLAML